MHVRIPLISNMGSFVFSPDKMFIQLHKTFILDLMIIAMREAIQASKKGEIHKLWTFLAVYHWLREKKIALS